MRENMLFYTKLIEDMTSLVAPATGIDGSDLYVLSDGSWGRGMWHYPLKSYKLRGHVHCSGWCAWMYSNSSG